MQGVSRNSESGRHHDPATSTSRPSLPSFLRHQRKEAQPSFLPTSLSPPSPQILPAKIILNSLSSQLVMFFECRGGEHKAGVRAAPANVAVPCDTRVSPGLWVCCSLALRHQARYGHSTSVGNPVLPHPTFPGAREIEAKWETDSRPMLCPSGDASSVRSPSQAMSV